MLNQEARTTITVLLVDTASFTDPTSSIELSVPGSTSPVKVSLEPDTERSASDLREILASYAGFSVSVGSALSLIGVQCSHEARAGLRYLDVPVDVAIPLRDNHAALLAGIAGVASSRLIL